MSFSGFGLSDMFLSRNAVSRSISAENPTGEKGAGAAAEPDSDFPSYDLGRGWKAAPARRSFKPGETITLAEKRAKNQK